MPPPSLAQRRHPPSPSAAAASSSFLIWRRRRRLLPRPVPPPAPSPDAAASLAQRRRRLLRPAPPPCPSPDTAALPRPAPPPSIAQRRPRRPGILDFPPPSPSATAPPPSPRAAASLPRLPPLQGTEEILQLVLATAAVAPWVKVLTATEPEPRRPLAPPWMPGETGMEQVFSDLQALKRLYGLLHKGQAADESLDETSRALLMRMLDDATQQALLRQAKMLSRPLMSPTLERKLSIQPDRLTRDAVPRIGVKLPASPSPSLLASERSRRLKKPQSSVRSRDGHRVLGHHRLSRTAMPGHYADLEQRHGSRRSSKATKPQHDTVDGGTHRGERQDRPRWGSGRGDQSSLERSDCSVSRAPSTPGRPRPHGRATARHVGAEGSSTHRFGRLDYGLSVSITTSRRGSGRAGRGATTPKRSSSSNRTVMIRSRIRPNRELMERCLRRADEEAKGESPRRRRRKDGAVATSVSVGWSSHPRRTLNWIDSKSTYSSSSSGAVSLFPSTSHMASLTSAASASSSSPVSRGSNVPPEYTFEASSASRSCRRRERQERREGRLRRLKNKLALVFHHRHDHHHHYFGHGQSGNQDGFSRHERRTHHRMSLWRYLGGMFHRSTGHERNKKTASRMVASVLVKRRGSGGGVRHMWGAPQQRAPALARMRRTGSRVQVKKLHWWQRLRRRRGRVDVGGRSRKRCLLGQGKKAM